MSRTYTTLGYEFIITVENVGVTIARNDELAWLLIVTVSDIIARRTIRIRGDERLGNRQRHAEFLSSCGGVYPNQRISLENKDGAIGVHRRDDVRIREVSEGVGGVGLSGNPIDFHNRSVPAISEKVGDDQTALEVRDNACIA